MTVEKANEAIHTVTRTDEALPKVLPIVESTRDMPEVDERSGAETRMAMAVSGQSRTVSKNTSHIPRSPAVAGLSEMRECAREDVPAPASLERRPREKPSRNAVEVINPTTPPTAAFGVNAERMTSHNTDGSREMLKNIVGGK